MTLPQSELLAKRLDKVMQDYDLYDYRNSDVTLEYFENTIRNTPEVVITGLLDMIEELMNRMEVI